MGVILRVGIGGPSRTRSYGSSWRNMARRTGTSSPTNSNWGDQVSLSFFHSEFKMNLQEKKEKKSMDAHLGKRKRDRGGYTGTAIRNQPQRQNSRCGQGDQEQEALPTPVDTTYRILCSGVKIGTVIGRGGGIIKSLRKETNARIKVLESVPGAEERVILVWSTQRDDERKKHRDGALWHGIAAVAAGTAIAITAPTPSLAAPPNLAAVAACS